MPCANMTCKVGQILPLFDESEWHVAVRGLLYCIALLWFFVGVAIIADVFMCSIETITSKTRKVKYADTETGVDKEVEVKVWNDTVANLTLMALGSSAPEILLSVIEIAFDNFEVGQLGPGTIVGSAAFNLLVITAVCIISVGEEGRRIYSIKVFFVTSFFSLFAYLWLIIILVAITPEYVDLWEAILTFLFFPILVTIAYLMDKQFCCKRKVADSKQNLGLGLDPNSTGPMEEDVLEEFVRTLSKDPTLTEEEIKKLAAKKFLDVGNRSRAWYRVNATRNMTGGRRIDIEIDEKLKEKLEGFEERVSVSRASMRARASISVHGQRSVIEFVASSCAILENEKRVKIAIERHGNCEQRVSYNIETVDGTAVKGEDYIEYRETRTFEPGETEHMIEIEIIDDNEWEPDEIFFVKLSLDKIEEHKALIGHKNVNQVTIINDDEPGTFEFANPSYLFKGSSGEVEVPILRINGADGRAWVEWQTEEMSAKAGTDFETVQERLEFAHGEITKSVVIPLLPESQTVSNLNFRLRLLVASEGAKIGRVNNTVVTIVDDQEYRALVDRLMNAAHMDLDAVRLDQGSWKQQFYQAMNVNGGEIDDAGAFDYFMHFFTFAWKVFFAFIPPPKYVGGWLAFTCSLGMIAILTMLVSDIAKVFGCVIGLKDAVTAITLVALGTSLPDLFASRAAATGDKYADNAIGNVTGSNSVNVFLGLGLPWFLAAIYHTVKGNKFKVPTGNLVFSVILYTISASLCQILLMVRRCYVGELGGSKLSRYLCGAFLIMLWVLYIIISSLQTYGIIKVRM